MLINSLVILYNSIPFIHCNDHAFAIFMGNTCDLGILLCHPFRSIDHHNYHICPLYSCHCTDHAIALDLLFDILLSSKACCINKYIISAFPGDFCIHCIPGGTCNIRYDHTVFSKKLVHQRRFAYIGLSYNGNLGDIIILTICAVFRKMLHHLIQHISQPLAVSC